ncbi:MAG: flagellar assembly protein FliW [Sediminispirochaetaceae bacterium]
MKVNTKPYGLIEVDERQRITFPAGILGFENLKEYVLLDALQQPFYWLQSLDVQKIAFVLIEPTVFRPDYTPDVADTDLEAIGIDPSEMDKLLIFAIVTVPENYREMTANLQGPVIINRETHVGRQCVTLNQQWKTRHKIVEELSQVRNNAC